MRWIACDMQEASHSDMRKHAAAARFEQNGGYSQTLAQDVGATARVGCFCSRVERWDARGSVEVWLSNTSNLLVSLATAS